MHCPKLALILLFSAIALAACAGCNRAAESAQPEVVWEEGARDMLLYKQNSYVILCNEVNNGLLQSLYQYSEILGWEPRLRQGDADGLPMLWQLNLPLCEEAAGLSEQSPKMQELDLVVQRVIPLLKEVHGALEEAYGYYANGAHLMDDYEKGQDYHTRILNLYTELEPNIHELNRLVEEIVDERHTETISYCQENGLLIEYHLLSLLREAQEVANCYDERAYSEIVGKLATLNQHIDGYSAALADPRQAVLEPDLINYKGNVPIGAVVESVREAAEAVGESVAGSDLWDSDVSRQLRAAAGNLAILYNDAMQIQGWSNG